jgi:hypothetical protein
MCGLSFKTEKRVEVQENDRIEFFTRETKIRTRRYILTRALGTIALAAATYVAYRYYAPEPK